MAEGDSDPDDKTEDATPERRDDFCEKGQIAHSQELSQVCALAAMVSGLGWYGPILFEKMREVLTRTFQSVETLRIDQRNILSFLSSIWIDLLKMILPIFIIGAIVGAVVTLLQTQFNWSWEKLEFKWNVLNPFPGIARMF